MLHFNKLIPIAINRLEKACILLENNGKIKPGPPPLKRLDTGKEVDVSRLYILPYPPIIVRNGIEYNERKEKLIANPRRHIPDEANAYLLGDSVIIEKGECFFVPVARTLSYCKLDLS